MQIKGLLGVAVAIGLGSLAAGCAQPAAQTMATPATVRDTGSMQIPDSSMGNLRQGAAAPGSFQAEPAVRDTGSMQIPDSSMGNLRRTPASPRTRAAIQANPEARDTGSMQIPENSMGNLRR